MVIDTQSEDVCHLFFDTKTGVKGMMRKKEIFSTGAVLTCSL